MSALTFPDAVDAAAGEAARDALEAAPTGDRTLALVSGGHDSLTAMHLAYQSEAIDLDGIIHINTGIGIPETRQFVRQRAEALDLPFYLVGETLFAGNGYEVPEHEYRLPREEYVHLIEEYGFPGPGAHRWMYVNLKEKPLQRFVRDQFPDEDLTFISGVRQHESDRRMENVDDSGLSEFIGHPTVSPLVAFRGIDVTRYRSSLDLPPNPVVQRLEMSGECLCGSYASRGELRDLRLFYPDVFRRLLCLERRVQIAAAVDDDGPDKQYGQWGHNRLRDRERRALDDTNQMLLCSSCEQQTECNQSDDSDPDAGGGCSE
jgi:3'-phosphoadenosine 5'-phosphosulfate sulfotransferase (PAPS reductase)/FAD synthetase